MKLLTEKYTDQQERLPTNGKQIIGQFDEEKIIVYQAYKPSIANFAVTNKFLGGKDYSYTRMTWIKPGFIWMMFRSGWATQENQERILAISIGRSHFETILKQAVHTSFKPVIYPSSEDWNTAMKQSDVRIQWDPDHYPNGKTLNRKAIQLGLKGQMAEQFAKKWILDIEDITDFVIEQKKNMDTSGIGELIVPKEDIYTLSDSALIKQLDL
ncbi:DUF4291 domain-containing protein [Xanthocytophaga agilis]|uniref:DUF4291 domain-containing protein n=1 Tax=Xanthocytophaga agilis TaxID=3048010 RepID=A0AAE3UGH0_9BACT|nr:DUF4291 domain-containing protein [Xanthocytophaga agilis]MDJ1504390.1 DUF4291 domain-containing protein [Xanthocytophaga agilis]